MGFLDYFTSDLAIDLGTANTLIICNGNIVVDEPSIIAIDRVTNKVIAIGSEAMQMHENHSNAWQPCKFRKTMQIHGHYVNS